MHFVPGDEISAIGRSGAVSAHDEEPSLATLESRRLAAKTAR
jgi:hypothetical protein